MPLMEGKGMRGWQCHPYGANEDTEAGKEQKVTQSHCWAEWFPKTLVVMECMLTLWGLKFSTKTCDFKNTRGLIPGLRMNQRLVE